jgi:hypothetical protein
MFQEATQEIGGEQQHAGLVVTLSFTPLSAFNTYMVMTSVTVK